MATRFAWLIAASLALAACSNPGSPAVPGDAKPLPPSAAEDMPVATPPAGVPERTPPDSNPASAAHSAPPQP